LPGRSTTLAWTVRVVRLFRYGLYIFIAASLWWLLSHFAFVRIQPGDASVTGVSGLHRLLVERYTSDNPDVKRGDVVVFAMLDPDDKPIFRVSRALAVPGDTVTVEDGFYAVNGKRTEVRASGRKDLLGTLPEGRYMVINDHPLSEFADSLRLGWIPRESLIGRFVVEMPF
jgi:signal peptidase I